MKNTILLFALFIGFSAFGQEKEEQAVVRSCQYELITIEEFQEIFFPPKDSSSTTYSIEIGEISNCSAGVLQVKDYPNTSVITGAVYTAEYIKYTPRY